MRIGLIICGWIFVGVGIVGLVTPIMPGFVFLLMALWCFARSSPRFENWMLQNPRFGESLRAWRREKSILRKHKVYAIAAIALSIALSSFSTAPIWAKLICGGAGLCVAVYLYTRPTRSPKGMCPLRPDKPSEEVLRI